jgi:hypothetical protein
MSNKTISINPNLFSIGKNKTKKNIDKKPKINNKPFISPNILKNKLLKRIKEHKNKETHGLSGTTRENEITPNSNNVKSYSDEFNDSINYLQTLSKQKNNTEKETYNKNKIRQEIENRTVKNYNSTSSNIVNLNLPEELQNPLFPIENVNFVSDGLNSMQINRKQDSIPYGVLKGGLKPTYRDWNKTQRNLEATDPNFSLLIQSNKVNSERENRLHSLREKLKQKKTNQSTDEFMMTTNLIQRPKIESLVEVQTKNPLTENPVNKLTNDGNNKTGNAENNIQNNANINSNNNGRNKLIKRTIKRKYTLGKSDKLKRVAVLIKDRQTRKNIINTQKELKKTNITDVRKYLRQHGIIKVGTTCPPDILRKTFEAAVLTGEVTNTNKETLLHNFLNEDTTNS